MSKAALGQAAGDARDFGARGASHGVVDVNLTRGHAPDPSESPPAVFKEAADDSEARAAAALDLAPGRFGDIAAMTSTLEAVTAFANAERVNGTRTLKIPF
jgi:hypothetical protein